MNDRNIEEIAAETPGSLGGLVNEAIRHDFDYITSAENLFVAWERFRRGKRGRADVQAFEPHLEANIFDLSDRLRRGQYRHSPYQPFTIHDPKQRQINKATVVDRLVHQAVVQVIEPLYERGFIYDSYSCRVGKGTHVAIDRLRTFLRRASRNDAQTVYALKLDIRKFFANVDHDILIGLLKRKIVDPDTINLMREIIDSFSSDAGRGIPLGNLTSQLFANIYLHELDWHIKQQIRFDYYLRYCDDFIFVSTNREALLEQIEPIQDFLTTYLRLQIHPDKIHLRSWQQGIDFLGYVLKPDCTLVRTKTRLRMLSRLEETNLTSYLGVCSHADSFELQLSLHNNLWLNI